MATDTDNAFRARESQVLLQISSFVRKQPQEKGCKQLLALAKETDLSYIPLLISTANKYFAPVFYMWRKYELSLGKDITAFMNTLHSKITHSKIITLRSQFQIIKDKYQRASRRRVVLLKETQISMEESDNKLKSLVADCQKIRNQSTREKRSLVVQHMDTEKAAPPLATIDEDIGKNYQQTRLTVFRQLCFKIKLSYQKEQSRNIQARLVHKLQERPVISRDCLNCLSFVYEDEDLNFPCSKQPVSYFGRILSLSAMQRDILKQIISYLNGSGGVLLIGTQRVGNKIIPIVEEIAQFHKEQQENRLQAALAFIWPAVSLTKQQIEHAFIPIAENCRKNPQVTQPVWKGNGACILRITVNPTEPHKVYHYSIPTNTSNQAQADPSLPNIPPPAAGAYNFYRHTELGIRELKDEEIYEFMKNRYHQYDPSSRPVDFVLRDRGNFHPCLINHIDRCRPAEKGNPFYGEHSYYEDAQKKRENILKSINPLLTPGVQSFKSITLLVVVSSLLERITNILSSQQKLQSKILPAFKHIRSEPFKLSNNTFLIFHNCKFQKLKNGINRQKAQLKAQNDKKDVILISTLSVLSLKEEDMTEQVQRQLEREVTEVAKEKLQFKFIDGVCYVKCLSAITAVYAYFYLHHRYNIRGKFEKLPQGSSSRSKQHKGANIKKAKAESNFDKPFSDRAGGGRQLDTGSYDKNFNRHKEYSYRDRGEDDHYSFDEDEQYEDQYEEEYEASPNRRQAYMKKEEPYECNYEYATKNTPSTTNSSQNNQYLNSSQCGYVSTPSPVEQYQPQLVYSEIDYPNGFRYDYYNNSVVYIFVLSTGQYYDCRYYQMPNR